eukprot:4499034-Prymnesium_polylepis.1
MHSAARRACRNNSRSGAAALLNLPCPLLPPYLYTDHHTQQRRCSVAQTASCVGTCGEARASCGSPHLTLCTSMRYACSHPGTRAKLCPSSRE